MTVEIWVDKLSENRLVLHPIYNSLNGNNFPEAEQLKNQLAQLGLKEGEDYRVFEVEDNHKRKEKKIEFSGKSCVVRALWTIPKNILRLYAPVTEAAWEKAKLKFATSMTKKECFAEDIQHRNAAFNNFHVYIKSEISKIHGADAKKTAVMEQLDKDLLLVDAMPADDVVWPTPKSHYALACLAKATADEKAQPTVAKPYRPKCLFTPESVLAPKYENILKVVFGIQDSNFGVMWDALLRDHTTHIVPLRDKAPVAAVGAPLLVPKK